jgi:hypothetical protein
MYIKDNIQRVKVKVMEIKRMMMAESIMDSTRMICSGEREYSKTKTNYTH